MTGDPKKSNYQLNRELNLAISRYYLLSPVLMLIFASWQRVLCENLLTPINSVLCFTSCEGQ